MSMFDSQCHSLTWFSWTSTEIDATQTWCKWCNWKTETETWGQASGGVTMGAIVLAKCEYVLCLIFFRFLLTLGDLYIRNKERNSQIMIFETSFQIRLKSCLFILNNRKSDFQQWQNIRTCNPRCVENSDAERLSLQHSLLLYLCYQQLPAQGLGVEEVPTYPDFDTSYLFFSYSCWTRKKEQQGSPAKTGCLCKVFQLLMSVGSHCYCSQDRTELLQSWNKKRVCACVHTFGVNWKDKP